MNKLSYNSYINSLKRKRLWEAIACGVFIGFALSITIGSFFLYCLSAFIVTLRLLDGFVSSALLSTGRILLCH